VVDCRHLWQGKSSVIELNMTTTSAPVPITRFLCQRTHVTTGAALCSGEVWNRTQEAVMRQSDAA